MIKGLSWRTGLGTILMMALWVVSNAEKDPGITTGIPPSTVADYVHAVIEAHRTFYTLHVVERLQIKGVLVASQNWRAANTLPLPAQFLIESGELAAKTGSKVTYRLIGLWPINKKNGAATEFERRGLEDVQMHPERPYTTASQEIVSSISKRYTPIGLSLRLVSGATMRIPRARSGTFG